MYSEEKLQKIKDRAYRNKLRSYKKHLINQREKRNKFFAVNDNLQFIETSNRIGSLRNCLRWYVGESKEHVMKKLELCMDLKENKHEFLCEAKFKTGGRCDVLDLTNGIVYEILHSETDK
ncbi:MAG: DUF2333 family protein [Nanoarchaeota archaeon]|nr:DUF2333 family protein [Patescibacteria group bacterium]MCG2719993.1 DUF2333 family protein [Nanoarchaeota archaeon]